MDVSFLHPIPSNNRSFLPITLQPTNDAMVQRISYIHTPMPIDPQLIGTASAPVSTSNHHTSCRSLLPFHDAVVHLIGYIHRTMSADEVVTRMIQLLKSLALTMTTGHNGSLALSPSVSLHLVFFMITDVEIPPVIHRQTMACEERVDCLDHR